jgi:hypothetical protein
MISHILLLQCGVKNKKEFENFIAVVLNGCYIVSGIHFSFKKFSFAIARAGACCALVFQMRGLRPHGTVPVLGHNPRS